ncbi:hypothetical protein FACS189472_19030 [Alphaproteobacteria bacterium]|nr:hypothetical protein FACS189472_19030 [Alphaproteobacteria bacterium]
MQHNKGEILDSLNSAEFREVNCLRGIPLEFTYYVIDDKVYKKIKNGKFRTLVKQETRPEYNHYFFRDKNKKKLTLNAKKLHLLTLENLTQEKGNESQQSCTESGTEITEAKINTP